MIIGVWMGDCKPQAGGAFSLIQSIEKKIENNIHTYLMLFKDQTTYKKSRIINGLRWVNLSPKKSLTQRIIKRFMGRNATLSDFDNIAIKEKIDIFYIAFPDTINTSYPYIYTVWDLGHREVPFFPEVSRTGWDWESRENCYKQMLYKASFIITGNNEGKNELLRNYSIPENKIVINPFPISDFCFKSMLNKPSNFSQEDFIFYPSQFWPHKNHIRILQALSMLRKKGLDVHVVFTGADKGNLSYIQQKASDYRIDDLVHYLGFVEESEMLYLYKNAKAMVFASLMGPNNMPPIEATVLGCPVIITNLRGHREQLGDSALYFDGLDAKDLALKIEQVYSDESSVQDLRKKQAILSSKFIAHNYFEKLNEVFNTFSLFRECWGETYEHT